MDRGRRALSESRVHAELLRAQVEMGFSLVHLAEIARDEGEQFRFRTALDEARSALSECKRLLGTAEAAEAQTLLPELALLEYELHDLEPVQASGSSRDPGSA